MAKKKKKPCNGLFMCHNQLSQKITLESIIHYTYKKFHKIDYWTQR